MFYDFKQVEDDIIVQYLVLLHVKQMCLHNNITQRNDDAFLPSATAIRTT